MTSNIRKRGPSGKAFKRVCDAVVFVGILLELSLEVPQEALFAFFRPHLRRTELTMVVKDFCLIVCQTKG